MLIDAIHTTLSIAGSAAAVFTLPGTWALARWTWAARRQSAATGDKQSDTPILILVPAHNEASTLPKTLPRLVAQAERDGRCAVLVIADNCSDNTAEVARSLGAMTLCRNNTQLRGKGHALAYAFNAFANYPWYLIVDADSTLDEHYLAQLRRKIATQPDAIQSRYEPSCAIQDPLADLKRWALRAFNVVRQRGRANLGQSVSLLGNGFAISAHTLAQVPFQAGSIVEDFEYQLKLQAHGLKISWLEDSCVHGEMPQGKGEQTQRVRWEGGRLAMLRQYFMPSCKALVRGQRQYGLALEELMLLPLNLHLALLLLATLSTNPISILGLAGIVVMLGHIGLALSELKPQQRMGALAGFPRYFLWKLAQLPAILRSSAKDTPWLRSERQADGGIRNESH
ncbi:glycosyltransferase family 2 protein [Chitinibacter sp. SCUT-21]|uniref:glycosyltransferase family 2 protein n=1 Tax=Chitinibacter sp. SCUT-21 TaxID=2970891 RepID=UPI0035A5B132